jgi:membrane-associated phospholipid phosphatase
MYWQIAEINKRLKSAFILWIICIVIAGVWTIFGDLQNVTSISHKHWLLTFHRVLHSINDKSMLPFYFLFIGIIIWAKFTQHKPLYLIGVGYVMAQMIGSVLIVRTLKILTGHARPETLIESAGRHTDLWIGPSISNLYNGFPSGHTSDFFVSAIFLAICLPKTWMRVLIISFAAFNGFLRVALEKHFPLDVLGGLFIGGVTTFLVWQYWIFPRLKTHEITINKNGF